jgi:hypothetical protein
METVIRYVLEVGAIITMPLGVVLVFCNRKQADDGGRTKGLGVRTLQHLALLMVIPAVFVLALERAIDAQAAVAIFGAVVGYILSPLGQPEE